MALYENEKLSDMFHDANESLFKKTKEFDQCLIELTKAKAHKNELSQRI